MALRAWPHRRTDDGKDFGQFGHRLAHALRERAFDRAAAIVTQHHDQVGAQTIDRIADTFEARAGDRVARQAHHEEATEPWSKINSGARRESEHDRMTANGAWPPASSARLLACSSGWPVVSFWKR